MPQLIRISGHSLIHSLRIEDCPSCGRNPEVLEFYRNSKLCKFQINCGSHEFVEVNGEKALEAIHEWNTKPRNKTCPFCGKIPQELKGRPEGSTMKCQTCNFTIPKTAWEERVR